MVADFATCEVDDFNTPSSIASIMQLLSAFSTQESEEALDPDKEWVIKNGCIQVGRFYSFPLCNELVVDEPNDSAVLRVGTPGRLNSLEWQRSPRQQPTAGEVEVQIYSAGLNFRVIHSFPLLFPCC